VNVGSDQASDRKHGHAARKSRILSPWSATDPLIAHLGSPRNFMLPATDNERYPSLMTGCGQFPYAIGLVDEEGRPTPSHRPLR
jgi:hypothetical protein